jgi:hypothetical protein
MQEVYMYIYIHTYMIHACADRAILPIRQALIYEASTFDVHVILVEGTNSMADIEDSGRKSK